MSITEYAVKNTAVSYFIAFLIVVGGIGSFFSLGQLEDCLLYTSPSPRDGLLSRMPSSA